jgi:hypothetical protein
MNNIEMKIHIDEDVWKEYQNIMEYDEFERVVNMLLRKHGQSYYGILREEPKEE